MEVSVRWIHGLVFFSLVLGCGEDFVPASQVDGLRVLAIEASPPTIQCDVTQTFSELAEGQINDLSCSETTELRALTHSTSDIQYHWSACLFDTTSLNAFACAEESLECCLSEEETATFSLASLMLAIGTGECADECSGNADEDASTGLTESGEKGISEVAGFIVSSLEDNGVLIRLRATSLGEEVEAVKSVMFSSGEELNANPIISALRTDAEDCAEPDDDGLCELLEETVLEVSPGQQIRFSLTVTEESEEDYTNILGDSAREAMQVFAFATDGGFKKEVSYGQPAEHVWVAPSAADWMENATLQMWFVVRDGRGGVVWTTRTLVPLSGEEASG